MAELGGFYARFMDDWVVLAPTRWKLRKAIKAVNQVMAQLRVEKHPFPIQNYEFKIQNCSGF